MNAKLDGRLAARVHGLTKLTPDEARIAATERVTVLIRITGELAAVEQAGLRTELVSGDVALGTIALGDLEGVAALDDVLSIDAERMTRPALHASLPAIHADHLHSGVAGLTGSAIVIGVVDSGIDIFHQAFRKDGGATRLLSLMDLTIRNTITITGGPTGGTFTLSWDPPAGAPGPGTQSAIIAFDATGPVLQAALEALPAIDPGDIVVTGGPLPGAAVVVDFVGRYEVDGIAPLAVTAEALAGGTAPGAAVQRGREFDVNAIGAALGSPDTPFPSVDRSGHGTNVAGIAAGDGSQSGNCHLANYYVGVAPNADLIAVKTSFTNADNIRGAQYVFDRAQAQQPAKQAVVNFSLNGGFQGARDGTDADDVALDNMVAGTRGRALVIAAGNQGGLYDHANPPAREPFGSGLHSRKHIVANQAATMQFIVRAGDRSGDLFELWYSGPGRLDFNLSTPGGVALPAPLHPNAGLLSTALAGHPIFANSNAPLAQNGRNRIQLRLDPDPATQVVAASAVPWTITLTETAGADVDVDCWIHKEPSGDPYPRFINADQDATRTITSPGTANNAITVGAYDPASHNALADFSSHGPRVDELADHRKPDLSAPGVNITAAKSRARNTGIWSDCCTDFYSHFNGTSQATPHVTGIVALMFENQARTDTDPAHWLTFEDVRRRLVNNCDSPGPLTQPPLPNFDYGAGIVNAEAAVGAETGLSGRASATSDDDPLVLPTRAYVAAYLPAHVRARELERRLGTGPSGQLAAYLVSTHVDEVRRLLETNRRVALAWHRAHGPVLIRLLLRSGDEAVPLIPRTLGGVPVAAGLERLIDELARWGSPALQADVALHRAFVLSLPGARLHELDRMRQAS